MSDIIFAAVRAVPSESREWVDVTTASFCRDFAQLKASATDAEVPQWAGANPVVRVAQFQLTEMSA